MSDIDNELTPWAQEEVKRILGEREVEDYHNDKWRTQPLDEALTGDNEWSFMAGQREAFKQLSLMADAYFEGLWAKWTIKPRLQPLLVAPSGHGKNWIIRALTKELKVGDGNYLRVSAAGWVPVGARHHNVTLNQIRSFLLKSESSKMILHIDELDKFHNFEGEWSRFCAEELFAILDRDTNHSQIIEWSEEARLALQYRLFIVGSGTWQNMWADSQKTVGFGESEKIDENFLRAQKEIPEELLFRFCNGLILIKPWTNDELIEMIKTLGSQIPPEIASIILSRSNEIIESKRGVRYIEDILAIWMMKQRVTEEGENV